MVDGGDPLPLLDMSSLRSGRPLPAADTAVRNSGNDNFGRNRSCGSPGREVSKLNGGAGPLPGAVGPFRDTAAAAAAARYGYPAGKPPATDIGGIDKDGIPPLPGAGRFNGDTMGGNRLGGKMGPPGAD